jgi:hypothetical protein
MPISRLKLRREKYLHLCNQASTAVTLCGLMGKSTFAFAAKTFDKSVLAQKNC